MPKQNFADLLAEQMQLKRSQVVVGLDPRYDHLPEELVRPAEAEHGKTPLAAAEAIMAFNRGLVDAVAEHAVAVKCQVAFYERFGVEGMRAYADVLRYARQKGLVTIGDVKRNDIASTAQAYAAAHLGPTDVGVGASTDFHADAITINPYLGSDGVEPFLESAAFHGRGVFALVKTSNPSSVDVQDVECRDGRVYEHVARLVDAWGEPYRGACGYSVLGAVAGATFPDELVWLRGLMSHTLLLVPGFGAQGGGVKDALGAFDRDGFGAVVSSSRGIIFAWERQPYCEEYGEAGWREAARAAAAEMQGQLWSATH